MINIISGLQNLIVGIVATAGLLVSPASPVPSTPTPSPIPFIPLTGENFIYVRGTYSYLGQSVNYFLLVPRKGGSFSGSIEGACKGALGGNYAGGEGGEISGNAGGTCSFLFTKYEGSANFKGQLYPDKKLIKVELENSPLSGPIELNYN